MSKTPSLRLRLPLMQTGDDPNAWGEVLNGLFQRVDESQGAVTVPVSGNVALTNDNYVTNQARYAAVRTTGTGLAGNVPALVTLPTVDKWRIVKNDCAGDITLGTGAGAAATVRAGTNVVVLCDGTDTFVIDPPLNKVAKPTGTVDANGQIFANGADGVNPTDFATVRQTGGSAAAGFAAQAAASATAAAGSATQAANSASAAATSAAAAQTFDPANYFAKSERGQIVGLSYGPDALA